MSFCFNFDLPAQTTTNPDSVDGDELQNRKKDNAAKPVSNVSWVIMLNDHRRTCKARTAPKQRVEKRTKQ